MGSGRSAQRLEESQCNSYLQEGRTRKLQYGQPHLDEVMEQQILETISRQMKDKKITRSSQHGFIKGKSRLTNQINFYDKINDWLGR